MHILHVTAHLGGGVGKAHASMAAAMPFPARQSFLLLEEPRDPRYADEIERLGRRVNVAASLEDVARHAAKADIVQFEFWNHPKLFECLARTNFPKMRTVMWSHISGLFRPVIRPEFFTEADRFVFTSPASLEIPYVQAMPGEGRQQLAVIGSAFGFESGASPSALPGISPSKGEIGWSAAGIPITSVEFPARDALVGRGPSHLPISPLEGEMSGRTEGGNPAHDSPICYLGTVDFIKMNPGFFEAIDNLRTDVTVAIWGSAEPSGEVSAKAAAMRHPDRIRFMGQTSDPRTALSQSSIFFYPLQLDHYGTAENALIEAMSLGLVPVVLANPAECAIVRQGQTGFIASSIAECTEILEMLLANPDRVAEAGANAREVAASAFVPERSARQFVDLWSSLMRQEKRRHDFARITGATPRDWFEATQFLPGEVRKIVAGSDQLSKGTLAHFKSAFPDDPSWD
ncbi:glycosyltransferase family 4 protein [Rhizobium sp. TH2]|uniref:glycosyltransferase n=1 Tax=Rhizobium sp. TH2 TaxID=2775403 RepID=UPI0021573CF0|nr:glycosyltransferase [Rhizobium sp. TH2]UVC09669.1 glycosyltransferase family 4 protein [Rhizobium sp. TH2]